MPNEYGKMNGAESNGVQKNILPSQALLQPDFPIKNPFHQHFLTTENIYILSCCWLYIKKVFQLSQINVRRQVQVPRPNPNI